MTFEKYHGLGNDYLVYNPEKNLGEGEKELTPERVRIICDRNYGAGSDGILVGPLECSSDGSLDGALDGLLVGSLDRPLEGALDGALVGAERKFRVRILNPDGGEAEKSGNGVRIFARYLRDFGYVGGEPFTLNTLGGDVRVSFLDGRGAAEDLISVDMGRASFMSDEIPVAGARREVVGERMMFLGEEVRATCVTVGNPHCVILRPDGESPTKELAMRLGPAVESAPIFPNRINVQFMRVIDRNTIEIQIYERGAGYTLASGSSACAAACAARKLGLVDSDVEARAPGGRLGIKIDGDYGVRMTGPVERVCTVTMADSFLRKLP